VYSLSLSSLSPLTTRHKSNFVLCNPWYCFKLFRSSEQFHWMLKPASGSYKVHKHTHTHTHTHPHTYACVLLLSNPVACSRVLQTRLVHHFYLCTLHYFTFDPLTHPPTHPSPSSLHFFWLDHNEKTQSKLAGWLFQGGGRSCTHVLCFSKKLKKS
jgi:hypothetical protein